MFSVRSSIRVCARQQRGDTEFLGYAPRPHDLRDGRLVIVTHEKEDWPFWEMHPAGDEVVTLLSGEVDLMLQEGSQEIILSLKRRVTVIVPQGVWHRAIVREPGDMLFITRGAGTQHRPA
jgi:mannose-6-phosphate isomerase-like protein (cupin superfamily)